jgi:hypothetical protein
MRPMPSGHEKSPDYDSRLTIRQILIASFLGAAFISVCLWAMMGSQSCRVIRSSELPAGDDGKAILNLRKLYPYECFAIRP